MKNSFLRKHGGSLKTAGWGIAGLFVSISIIQSQRISLFGYPLFALSVLMFLLAIRNFLKEQT